MYQISDFAEAHSEVLEEIRKVKQGYYATSADVYAKETQIIALNAKAQAIRSASREAKNTKMRKQTIVDKIIVCIAEIKNKKYKKQEVANEEK